MPVPSLEEQRDVLLDLDSASNAAGALASLVAEASAELDALLLAILDRAFKGEL